MSTPSPSWYDLLGVAPDASADEIRSAWRASIARSAADRSVDEASASARSAAERAIVPILSYDAKDIDGSKAAAQAYLTGDFRKEYDKLYDGVIAENAPSTGTVLEAKLVSSGLVRAEADRVQVFLLVDQTRTNKADKQPVVYKNWVTVTMENVDGDWLVSGLDT